MGDCNGDGNGNGNRVGDGNGDGDANGNGDGQDEGDHYKGRVASSCGHLASTPMDTKESAFTSAASWG